VDTTTIRISQRARREARALADATGRPMSQVVEDAIHAERERAFWRQFREAAAAVAADPIATAEERAELDLLEGSLMDGLEDEGVPQ
jgi:predicted transcriptional regulator